MRNALIVFAAGVVLSGCGVELLTTTAIVGDLNKNQIQATANQIANAKDFSSKMTLESAVKAYYGEKGAYPPSLQALVPNYIASVPMKPDGTPFGYNPATGEVSEHSNPTMNAAADAQALQQIQEAIQKYGMASGFYPPSLQALVPTYIASIPKTSTGLDFFYDPTTGALRNPAGLGAPAPTAQPRAGVPVSGAGPMGETMTGIGIQNQLNSMSNAGSAAAGTRMRSGVDGAQQQHNQQQEKALQDIGG